MDRKIFIFCLIYFFCFYYAHSQDSLGIVNLIKGNYVNAIKAFDKAIKKNRSAELFILRGLAKSKLNNYKSAIRDFNRGIKRSKKFYEAFLARAIVKYEYGKVRSACKDWQKARLLGSNDSQIMIELCCCK